MHVGSVAGGAVVPSTKEGEKQQESRAEMVKETVRCGGGGQVRSFAQLAFVRRRFDWHEVEEEVEQTGPNEIHFICIH